MTTDADGTGVPRSRLCELAEVEPRKHARWIEDELVPKKTRYGRLDLIRAVTLDELRERLGPKSARAAWSQICGDLGIPSRQLDVVVDLAQDEAWLASTPTELARSLPRNTKIVVVDLAARARRALERYDVFVLRCAELEGASDDTVAEDTVELASRGSASDA